MIIIILLLLFVSFPNMPVTPMMPLVHHNFILPGRILFGFSLVRIKINTSYLFISFGTFLLFCFICSIRLGGYYSQTLIDKLFALSFLFLRDLETFFDCVRVFGCLFSRVALLIKKNTERTRLDHDLIITPVYIFVLQMLSDTIETVT